MSIAIAAIREDYIVIVTDSLSRSITRDSAYEDQQKIWKIGDGVYLAACGRLNTIAMVLNGINIYGKDMWPSKPRTTDDFASIISECIMDISENKRLYNNPDFYAAFILAGHNDSGALEIRTFYTSLNLETMVVNGEHEFQVFGLLPEGLTQDDCMREIRSILRQKNLCTSHIDPQQLADVCIQAIEKLAPRIPSINNKCQVKILKR